MSNLHAALEKQLELLPVMSYANGYPVQAMPKATLLDLLATHPVDPTPVIEVHVGEPIGTGGHDLVVSLGDCELYGECTCGQPLGSIKPDQSLDELGRTWEHHVMTAPADVDVVTEQLTVDPVMATELPYRGDDADPFDALVSVLAFSSQDWGQARDLAWLYGIVAGWTDTQDTAYAGLAARFGWSQQQVDRLRQLHASFQRAAAEWKARPCADVVLDERREVDQAAAGTAAAEAIIYNLPVDGFGQSKRLEEYAAIWGNAAAAAVLALIGGDAK